MKRNRLEARLGYTFNDPEYLTRALSHRSIGKHNNERLEFLGDAILGMLTAEILYDRYPDAKEGQLTQIRSSLVKGDTLAEIARGFQVGENLILGEGELKSGGFRRSSILEDAIEAIIGAIFLDSGKDISVCKRIILAWFKTHLDSIVLTDNSKDFKTRLQELLQKKNFALPAYVIVKEQGEAHEREFIVECKVAKLKKSTTGQGTSKRAAEKQAAMLMLQEIES